MGLRLCSAYPVFRNLGNIFLLWVAKTHLRTYLLLDLGDKWILKQQQVKAFMSVSMHAVMLKKNRQRMEPPNRPVITFGR